MWGHRLTHYLLASDHLGVIECRKVVWFTCKLFVRNALNPNVLAVCVVREWSAPGWHEWRRHRNSSPTQSALQREGT